MASSSTPVPLANISSYAPVQEVQKNIDRHWELMPNLVKQILVESARPVDLHVLAKFWSFPATSEFTRCKNAASLSERSWCLALSYLKLGKTKEARALTLNGSFIRQCSDVPIENIVKLCEEKSAAVSLDDFKLPIFSQAFHALRTPQTIEAFCLEQLPLPVKCVDMTDDNDVRQFVDKIGDSWSRDSSTRNRQTPSNKTASTEKQIQLILVCDANVDERQTLSIGSSTTLKTLFNEYAKGRGDSLRSLRFSHCGNNLFVSSAGNKTPDQLNMRDRDVITVHGASTVREIGSVGDASKKKSKASPKKAKSTRNHTKKSKGKDRKKRKSKQEEPAETLQKWKAQHSKKLSKLHEEVHHRLKEIRTRLNTLDLKCQLPKQKRKNRRKTKVNHNVNTNQILPHSGIGGKAGKSFFSVQVGEVQNLYKTSNKSSQKMSRNDATALLDLHGYTRGEALLQLDASLQVWVETAMRGSYPFVMPATIVCGGGNQILSEAVEKWIGERAQVANAMKNLSQ